jgi:release factor glutamine methyltransferase
VTVLEAIQKSAEFLSRKGVESPRLQTELLLAHMLKMPRMKLYLDFARSLSAAETDALREFVRRRGQREPLQHIIGSASFCGLEIAVNRDALVPRPETELLAELGWEFLMTRGHALDLGTGTGCIAIALAVKCTGAKIIATDMSADALALAKENAVKHQVSERIEFLQGDGLAALAQGWGERWGERPREPQTNAASPSLGASPHRFDLIISNPPYIPSAEIATLQPEVRDYDPRVALDGGADGLDFYRRLAVEAKAFLKPDGKMMLEFGDGQAEALRNMFEAQKWIVEAVREDYSHRPRILTVKSSSSSSSSS